MDKKRLQKLMLAEKEKSRALQAQITDGSFSSVRLVACAREFCLLWGVKVFTSRLAWLMCAKICLCRCVYVRQSRDVFASVPINSRTYISAHTTFYSMVRGFIWHAYFHRVRLLRRSPPPPPQQQPSERQEVLMESQADTFRMSMLRAWSRLKPSQKASRSCGAHFRLRTICTWHLKRARQAHHQGRDVRALTRRVKKAVMTGWAQPFLLR